MPAPDFVLLSASTLSATIMEERLLLGQPLDSWTVLRPESPTTMKVRNKKFGCQFVRNISWNVCLGVMYMGEYSNLLA